MRYLTAEEILVVHARIIDETGGSHGVRDVGLLASLIERPKVRFGGSEQYKGVFKKAAVYLDSLVRYHVFVDGNKRTAIAASTRFLFRNGYSLTATNKEVEKFVLEVAVERLDIKEIAEWIRANSEKKRAGQIKKNLPMGKYRLKNEAELDRRAIYKNYLKKERFPS